MLFCLSTTGCSIGIKEEVRLVYVSITQHAEVDGAIKIATNEPIPVTVEGSDNILTQLDLGGMYAISSQDLEVLINEAKKHTNPTE